MAKLEKVLKVLNKGWQSFAYSLAVFVMLIALAVSFALEARTTEATEHVSSEAHDYKEVVFNVANGLYTDVANAIAQTGDGFIWIGGYSGLTRYDGSEFYQIPSGSSGIYSVSALFVDREDQLWIGTSDSGVAMQKNGKYKFWNRGLGLASNTVRSITQNDQGVIFVATTKGLSMLKDGEVSTSEDLRLLNTYISKLVQAPNNKTAGITKKGDIFIYNGETLESYFAAKDFPLKNITSIAADRLQPDAYWLANAGNRVLRIAVSEAGYKVEKDLTTGELRGINELKQLYNESLFVATDSGVGYFDSQDNFHTLNDIALNSSVDTLMLDYEDNIWLTSASLGVAKLTHSSFKNIFDEVGLEPAVVNAVQVYQGAIYVATDGGLEVIKDGKLVKEHPLVKLLQNRRIRHLMVDSKNNLWISTYSSRGLIKYTPEGKLSYFNASTGLVSDRIRVTLEDSEGIIYVGTRDGLSLIKDDEVLRSFTMSEGLANSQVLCLLEHDGAVYAGTDGGGITVLRDGQIVDTIDEHNGLLNGIVLRMTVDPDGKGIWIATNTALAYLEKDQANMLTKFDSSNNFDIIFTEQNEMLVTCNKGIYFTNRELILEGKIGLLLTSREGLDGAPNSNSFSYLDKQGNLYLCLQNGVERFNVHDTFKSYTGMRLTVPSIKLDGVDYFFDETNTLTIPSAVDSISFRGHIVSNRLENAFLAVQLEGYDKSFRMFSRFKNQDCVYNNLPGGKYTLKIGIVDPQTNAIAKSKTYTIIKKSKLNEHTEVIAGIVFLLSMAGFWVYRSATGARIKQLAKKQKETERYLDEVIDAFAKAIDLKDHYTSGHSDRVAVYSKLIALELGLSGDEAENIYRIGKLHDVGKVIVPDDILNKPSRLTDEEFAVMKQHTDNGYKILSTITSFPRIAVGAKTHHERYDGRGYGHGLKGTEIPLEGRIIAVADAFDAMNSTRIYRPHLSREVILKELEKAKGTQLDAAIVDVLLRLIAEGKVVIEEAQASSEA